MASGEVKNVVHQVTRDRTPDVEAQEESGLMLLAQDHE